MCVQVSTLLKHKRKEAFKDEPVPEDQCDSARYLGSGTLAAEHEARRCTQPQREKSRRTWNMRCSELTQVSSIPDLDNLNQKAACSSSSGSVRRPYSVMVRMLRALVRIQ